MSSPSAAADVSTPALGRPRRRLGRASAGISALATLGVLAGFGVDATVAAIFGAGQETDAFFVAATIPFALGSVLLASANQALVPLIAAWFQDEPEDVARSRVAGLLGATLVLMTAVAAAGVLLSPVLPRVLAPGSSETTKSLASVLSVILFASVVARSGTEVLRAALNARFSFFPAALTPLVENLSVLAIVIAFGRTLGVTAIAVGYLTGGVAQLLYVASAAARRGLRLRPRWGLSDEAVRGGLRLVLLPIGTTGLSMGARAVERFLASFLPAGSITILNYAWVVVNSVGGAVFFRSVVVALLPSLAEAREPRARRRILAQGTRIMTLVSFPLTALVAVLALPLVSLAFQRGAFTRSSAELLASLLAIYALQLPLNALTRVFLSHFYARLDMVTPFLNGAIGVGIDVVLAVALFRPLGVRGLAVAYGVGAVGNIVHAYVRVRRETPFRITSEVAYMAKVAFAALLAGTIAFAAMMLVPAGGGLVARTVRLAVPGALALVGFVVALVVARAHRVSDVVAVLRHDRGKHRPGRHAARRVG